MAIHGRADRGTVFGKYSSEKMNQLENRVTIHMENHEIKEGRLQDVRYKTYIKVKNIQNNIYCLWIFHDVFYHYM